jgi:hypothetical protein
VISAACQCHSQPATGWGSVGQVTRAKSKTKESRRVTAVPPPSKTHMADSSLESVDNWNTDIDSVKSVLYMLDEHLKTG